MIAIAMLSLAGIPPFPGFVAKFLIFRNVIAAGYTLYAVLGLVGSYLGHLLLPARHPVPVHEHGGAARSSSASAGAPRALGASFICLPSTIVIAVFPGWVIDQL